jgi:hypothetical protein
MLRNGAASEGSREGEATERVEPAGGERAPVRSPDSRSPEILPMKKPSDRTVTAAAASFPATLKCPERATALVCAGADSPSRSRERPPHDAALRHS